MLNPRRSVRAGYRVIELHAAERLALRRTLDLDEVAVAGEHEVEVDVAVEVLAVIEIDARLAIYQSYRDRHDLIGQRPLLEKSLLAHPAQGPMQT